MILKHIILSFIAKYNRDRNVVSSFKKKDKSSDGAICIIGISENSVLSNDDVEISFKTSTAKTPLTEAYGNIYLMNRYYINIKNKTDKIIYIDLANCYRNEETTGDNYCYYDGKSVSVSHGNSSSVGLGVGTSIAGIGIGVGYSSRPKK